MLRYSIIVWLTFFITTYSIGQEICDNGIDDDGDGLIDLNDEDDCICDSELPSSLIPNPSFEERTCCPTMNAQLNCAVGWIQASSPTTDYINTCDGYLGNSSISNPPAVPPLPLADGEGAVGFRDGQGNVGSSYKEYVGACLTNTMFTGTSYRLEFFVGFRDNVQGSMSLDIAIFGTTSCNNLPFGGNSSSIGCPANTGLYDQIDIQSVSGSNQWVTVVFEFTAAKPYEVIVIGPGCAANPNTAFSPYFYLDGLTLAAKDEFGVPLEDIEGSICNDDLVLSIVPQEETTYQWYKDGIALVGETSPDIALINTPSAEGNYLVVLDYSAGCIASQSFNVRVPPYYAEFPMNICEGESFSIENESWTETGTYEKTIAAVDGCDSIITVYLDVEPTTYETMPDSYCEGDTYTLFDISTTSPGTYETTISNAAGCDSVLTIDLVEIPATGGIEIDNSYTVVFGDFIDLIPDFYDPQLTIFNWYDADRSLIGNDVNLLNLQPLESTTLSVQGIDEFGCDVEEVIELRVDRSSINIYTPNIFSPDGNNINDFFKFYATNALKEVELFVIYDRWGGLVYEGKNIVDFENLEGWDGYINNALAVEGVYSWMVKAEFLDETKQVFSGDLTLIRLH